MQFVLDQPEMASYRAMRSATLTVFVEGHQSVVLYDVRLVGDDPTTIEVALQPGDVGAFAGKVIRGSELVVAARVTVAPAVAAAAAMGFRHRHGDWHEGMR